MVGKYFRTKIIDEICIDNLHNQCPIFKIYKKVRKQILIERLAYQVTLNKDGNVFAIIVFDIVTTNGLEYTAKIKSMYINDFMKMSKDLKDEYCMIMHKIKTNINNYTSKFYNRQSMINEMRV